MSKSILALILAAGQGTRMRSQQPKVLQNIGGKPMIAHLLQTVSTLEQVQPAIVYGHKGKLVQEAVNETFSDIIWIEQKEQLGTGHAVKQAIEAIKQYQVTLILLGDAPLVTLDTMQALCKEAKESGYALLTAQVDNPQGYGRIIRDDEGQVCRIVEDKDADDEQRLITEINTGMMAISQEILLEYLPRLSANNAQKEYYLTDLVALLNDDNRKVSAVLAPNVSETLGINDRLQLAQAEDVYRRRVTNKLMQAGVTFIDPTRVDIHGELTAGQDVIIEANVVIKGKVRLGDNVVIESGSVLIDCEIDDNSHVFSHSRIEQSHIGEGAQIGPFARIRPNSQLAANTKVGNFVELKAAKVGSGSKVNHLSYIGDAQIGKDTNIGAGTITCNYDGANKHQTLMGDNVFVGSNTALVAPVSIGNGVTIGAGSVITDNVADKALAFTRAQLTTKANWIRPSKNKK